MIPAVVSPIADPDRAVTAFRALPAGATLVVHWLDSAVLVRNKGDQWLEPAEAGEA